MPASGTEPMFCGRTYSCLTHSVLVMIQNTLSSWKHRWLQAVTTTKRSEYMHQSVNETKSPQPTLIVKNRTINHFLRLWPDDAASRYIAGSLKSWQFILWAPWIPPENFKAIHRTVVEIFQSGPTWRTYRAGSYTAKTVLLYLLLTR